MKLSDPFPPDKVKHKPGPGGRKMQFISHGLVTERLNDVDPAWSSEVLTEHTYKDGQGRLHCEGVTLKLTVNGVSRVESGGPQRQDGFANEIKNSYSDALKRAAMRFGVALEMWESLVDSEGDEDYATDAPVTSGIREAIVSGAVGIITQEMANVRARPRPTPDDEDDEPPIATTAQLADIAGLMRGLNMTLPHRQNFAKKYIGRELGPGMLAAQAETLILKLQEKQNADLGIDQVAIGIAGNDHYTNA